MSECCICVLVTAAIAFCDIVMAMFCRRPNYQAAEQWELGKICTFRPAFIKCLHHYHRHLARTRNWLVVYVNMCAYCWDASGTSLAAANDETGDQCKIRSSKRNVSTRYTLTLRRMTINQLVSELNASQQQQRSFTYSDRQTHTDTLTHTQRDWLFQWHTMTRSDCIHLCVVVVGAGAGAMEQRSSAGCVGNSMRMLHKRQQQPPQLALTGHYGWAANGQVGAQQRNHRRLWSGVF